MAKCFTEWTVLPHEPIEKLADNLWRVTGSLNDGKVQRQMMLARLRDGRVLVHSAIALDEPEMAELEAWGTPSILFVPSSYHRQDAAIWKQRYPAMKVFAPAAARKRVGQIVAVDGSIEEAPSDDTVRLAVLPGVKVEGVLEVRSGDRLTLLFTDALMNVPPRSGFLGFLLAPTGHIAVPRLARWMIIKDRRAFRGALEAYAARPELARLAFCHGAPIDQDPAGALRQVLAQIA